MAPLGGLLVASLVGGGTAVADDAAPPASPLTAETTAATPNVELGDVALPGGLRVGYAEALPAKVFAVSFDGGFGYRSGLLADNHKMKRGIADVAFAYAATPWLTLGLSFDGRYDSHKGGGELTDNGWVGEPRLAARAVKAGGAVAFGGQLQLSAPGSDAPSVVPSALTVEARGLVSGQAGALRWAANAGFRLDNSANSIDMPGALTLADQASLGVSDWSAAVVGGRIGYRAGKLALGLEADARIFVGGDAPGPAVLAAATVDVDLTPSWALTGFVATNVVSKPAIGIDMMIPLQPYDPMIAFGVGLTARFGGVAPIGPTVDENPDEPDEPPAPVRASLRGVVSDDTGGPVAGATVTITAGDVTREVTTGDDGRFVLDDLPLGAATVTIAAVERKPRTFEVELTGAEVEAPATSLESVDLPTQIRGYTKSFRGAPVQAKISVAPGDYTVTADADGYFELDVPPGTYEVTCTAPNFVTQTRTLVVTEKSVTTYNFDLR